MAWSRRRFLWGIAVVSAASALRPAWAGVRAFPAGRADVPERLPAPAEMPRRLSFVHTHTEERLSVVYWQDGHYVPEGLEEVSHFLRDWRTGEATAMDPQLLDLLYDLARATGTCSPFYVVCGYRTQQTNEMLRTHSSGVAQHSMHLRGQAIDIRLADVTSAALRDTARALGRGGVGY